MILLNEFDGLANGTEYGTRRPSLYNSETVGISARGTRGGDIV